MFTHLNKLGDFELEANTIDGVRYYTLPSGKKAPSITSITSFYNRQIFKNWREKVGEEQANKITKVATDRGTKFHDLVEKYLLNEDINSLKNVLPTTKARWIAARDAFVRQAKKDQYHPIREYLEFVEKADIEEINLWINIQL